MNSQMSQHTEYRSPFVHWKSVAMSTPMPNSETASRRMTAERYAVLIAFHANGDVDREPEDAERDAHVAGVELGAHGLRVAVAVRRDRHRSRCRGRGGS